MAVATKQGVIEEATTEEVTAITAVKNVHADITKQRVFTIRAIDFITMETTVEIVIAQTTVQGVVA